MMALPVVFTFMFLWFPAGLVLYWVVNNLLSIAQQWVITKRVESGADATALKAKEGKGVTSGLGEQAKKLVTLAKQSLPDSLKAPDKRKK